MDVDTAAPPPSRREEYIVVARGTRFVLSLSQVEFDGPNFFTAAFLDHDFAESSSRTLYTDRHPLLFAIIYEYLAGYDVLPLQTASLPPTMSVEVATKNLAKDAAYFGLDGLKELIESPPPPFPLESLGFAKMISWDDMKAGKYSFRAERYEDDPTDDDYYGDGRLNGIDGSVVFLAQNTHFL